MASFACYSSLWHKTGTNDNALPEEFTSALALPEPDQSWDFQPRKMRAGRALSCQSPASAAAPVGSSMAHRGPGFSGGVLTAAPCPAGPQHPSASQWLMALGWSVRHGHWDITDVRPTLVGTDPQEKVFLGPVPCPGDRSLSLLLGWRGVSPLHGAFWLHGCSGALRSHLRSHQNVV